MKAEMEIVGFRTVLLTLLNALDERGVIPKAQFAAVLRNVAKEAEDKAGARIFGIERHDLALLRSLADLLTGPPPKGWTPIVIDGDKGKDPPDPSDPTTR